MHEHEIDEYLEIALAEQFTKPGTANVSPEDRKKLSGLLKHYAAKPHPFTSCKRDQMKHGLSEEHANRRCAVLKDLIKGTTKWRGKGKKEMSEEELAEIRLDIPEEFATWLNESSEQEIAGYFDEPEEEKRGVLRYIAGLMGLKEEDAREDTGEAESGVGDVPEEESEEESEDDGFKGEPDYIYSTEDETLDLHASHNQKTHGSWASSNKFKSKSRGGGLEGWAKAHHGKGGGAATGALTDRLGTGKGSSMGISSAAAPQRIDHEGQTFRASGKPLPYTTPQTFVMDHPRGADRFVEEKPNIGIPPETLMKTFPHETDKALSRQDFTGALLGSYDPQGKKIIAGRWGMSDAPDKATLRELKDTFPHATKVIWDGDEMKLPPRRPQTNLQLTVQLPYELSEAKPSGETPAGEKLYKKTLLQAGRSINYDDGKVKKALNFTDDFLKSMLSNLKAKAFDQIPLLSHHPKDPDKEVFAYLGELVDADIEDDRLVGTFKVTEKGDALLKDNPRLGTSVGYLEDWTRDDGEHFKGSVLQHVATTFKPRVNAPEDSWELVQMSSETFGGEVVDLTEARYSALTRKESGPVADDVQTPVDKEEVETVELSDDAKQAIKLAQDRADQALTELATYKELSQKTARELLEQKVERELDEYKLAGVPPAFIDRARPVLLAEASSAEVEVIELSQEGVATKKNVSIAAQTRSMLDFMRGTVDLSEEEGRSDVDPETSNDEAQHAKIQALADEKYDGDYRLAMQELSSRGEVTL